MEHIPFPFDRDEEVPIPDDDLLNHPCLRVLENEVDLAHTCGYISMLKTGEGQWVWCDRHCMCTAVSMVGGCRVYTVAHCPSIPQ